MEALASLDGSVSIALACAALGGSRATLYRRRKPRVSSVPKPRSSPRSLTDDERQRILDLHDSPEFVDQPPTEVYARLLSRGEYITSVRTIIKGEVAWLDESSD